MKSENVIVDKSYKFAIRIIKLYKFLIDDKKEYIISKQILKCGTSIGANINEAQSAESKMDFIHKLSISAKEIRETKYWLKLLIETDYISKKSFDSINKDCIELMRIINSIILTSKEKIKNLNKL
ncbi:MAG: four helix bundle protein [Ignavibacteria bacterium RIFOXYC2_FULL_35_21]|nr:MAG: four helix bundle protein [Ignavibacteria bacterium GWA2_35_8]OGU90772.1 MAG: four helix bundle protein [Ignavibacteria bacterium RIFOXYA2_FULL_35_10]OGV23730.1 MAG: four helix bundle protein [Ignavibacteria bacterium RIFOXYC2_FULL_35_21]